MDEVEKELLAVAEAFRAAVQRRDGLEARLARGELGGELLDRGLLAAEAVLQTRTALYRLLMDWGWSAPPRLVQDMAYDSDLLRHSATT